MCAEVSLRAAAHEPWPRDVALDPSSTALILIDLQRQFLASGSPLEVDGSADLVKRSNQFAADARGRGSTVIWVVQRTAVGHPPSITAERFGVAGIHDGDGADIDERLDVGLHDRFVVKRRQSAFFATGLEELLDERGVRTVLIAGVTTNVCVLATAKDAAERDLIVHVVEDLTRALVIAPGTTRAMSAAMVADAALTFAQYAYGDVTRTDRVRWEESGAPAGESLGGR